MSDHSSSVILKMMLSLVIALFINTEIDFSFCSISDQKDSRDSDEFKSRTYPSMPNLSKLSDPDSDVAVPMTSKPLFFNSTAMAFPIPLLAPVTKAVFSQSFFIFDNVSKSSRLIGLMSLNCRLISPVKTFPGPHSIKLEIPFLLNKLIVSFHLTGL